MPSPPPRLSPLHRCLPHLLVALLALSCKQERPEVGTTASAPVAKAPPAPTASSAPAPAPAPPVEIPLEERKKIAGQLSFVSERDGNREVYVIAPDGTGERRLTTFPEADYNGPASPDGSAILLTRVDGHEGPQQLFLQPVDGGAPKALTPLVGRLRHPSFSPDGRWIVYETDGDKGNPDRFSDIHRIGVDGKGAKRLTNNPEGNFEPAIAPGGDAIVLLSSRDRVAELYRIRPDGSEPLRLTETPRDEWGARFSPDGELIAFVSDRDGADRIYLMHPNGGPARRLSQRDLTSRVVEDRPTWSPVGKRLAYVLTAPATPARVVILDLEGGRESEVGPPGGSGQVGEPAWSPDGSVLALTVTQGKDPQIYLVRADGSGLTKLTASPGGNWNPHWIPPRRKAGK